MNEATDRPLSTDRETLIAALSATGHMFWQRGWSLGTSSNYSVVLNRSPIELLITASGREKQNLSSADFVTVDRLANPIGTHSPKPSAETLLHVVLAEERAVGSILHTHSVWGTLLSDIYFADGGFEIAGYEMLKGLEGVKTHETSVWVDVFDNSQDIAGLAEKVRARLRDIASPLQYGFLIRRHGLYTWGRDLTEARRHVEILEFLFECVGRRLGLMRNDQIPMTNDQRE
jgi:methylthioribulose-1-phosphate dehydratase